MHCEHSSTCVYNTAAYGAGTNIQNKQLHCWTMFPARPVYASSIRLRSQLITATRHQTSTASSLSVHGWTPRCQPVNRAWSTNFRVVCQWLAFVSRDLSFAGRARFTRGRRAGHSPSVRGRLTTEAVRWRYGVDDVGEAVRSGCRVALVPGGSGELWPLGLNDSYYNIIIQELVLLDAGDTMVTWVTLAHVTDAITVLKLYILILFS